MRPAANDWSGIALAKLTNVLGDAAGRKVFEEVMSAIGKKELCSSADLRLFAQTLLTRGGFAGAIGGLLSLHATMHGADPAPASEPDAEA